MFAKIKTLIVDIFKYQRVLILVMLFLCIALHLLFDINYKYEISTVVLNTLFLFFVYGLNAIRASKVYKAIYQFMENNKSEDIYGVNSAIFALSVFWNMMSLLLIVSVINYSAILIPSIVTYYMAISLTVIINIVAVQGVDYYNKVIKSLGKDFISKLEA